MPTTQSKLRKKVLSRKSIKNNRSLLILIILGIGLLLTVITANQIQTIRQFASEETPDSTQEYIPHDGDSVENFVKGRTEDQQPLVPGPQSRALCMGSGSDGPRVQVIYGYGLDQRNTVADWLPIIRGAANGASSMFDDSAKKTGGRRVIRYVTTPECQIDVQVVQLPIHSSELDDFDTVKNYLRKQKYLAPNKNVLFFADTYEGQYVEGIACGWGDIPYDDSAGWNNKANKGGNLAHLKKYCWSGVLAAHELMHTFGAVQHKAPNWNGVAHCTDDYDIMCYNEKNGKPVRNVCTDYSGENIFDCNNDDYYSFSPSGYLANHWNSAFSLFLDDPTRNALISVSSGGKDGITGKEKVSLSLSGFQPSEKVVLLWNDAKLLKEFTVDGNGALQGSFLTPDANQGQYRITIRGSRGSYAEVGIQIRKDDKKGNKKKNNNNNNNNNKNNGKKK